MTQQRYDIPLRLDFFLDTQSRLGEKQLEARMSRFADVICDILKGRITQLENALLSVDTVMDDTGLIESGGMLELFFENARAAADGAQHFDQTILLREDILSALRLVFPGVIRQGEIWLGAPLPIEIDRVTTPAETAIAADRGYRFGARGLGAAPIAIGAVERDENVGWGAYLPWLFMAAILAVGWLAWQNLIGLRQVRTDLSQFAENAQATPSQTYAEDKTLAETHTSSPSANDGARRSDDNATGASERFAGRGMSEDEQSRQDLASIKTESDVDQAEAGAGGSARTPITRIASGVQPGNAAQAQTASTTRPAVSAPAVIEVMPTLDPNLPQITTASASITPQGGGFISLDSLLAGGVDEPSGPLPSIYRGG